MTLNLENPLHSEVPVKVCLVGCGAVSKLFYAPALLELQRHQILQVTGLVDPSEASRTQLAQSFPSAKSHAEAHTAFADAQLAIIASPPKFHRAQTEAALAAGLNVLCEKPMASDSRECEAMIAAAAQAGRFLAVGHYKRFMPAHRAIKAFIEQQTFGPLQSIEIAEGGKFGWPAASDSFFRKEQTPGGVLLDIGVHVLDLLLWWLGEPADFTYADDTMGNLEANCVLKARYTGGATARVRLSRDWAMPQCYVFRFAKTTLHCRVNASNQLELTFDGVPMTFAAELRDPLPSVPHAASRALETNAQSFIAQLADVCAALREQRAPAISGEEGARAIRWIEDCYTRRQALPQSWNATS